METVTSTSAIVSPVISLFGLVAGVLGLIILLGGLGLFVVIVVANRAEPDPTSRRPLIVYLFGVAFIAVWTSLIGSSVVVASLVQLIGSHSGPPTGAIHPVGDASARGVVLGGIVLLVSLALLIVHRRKGVELAIATDPDSPPAFRVAQSYVSAVAFTSVLIMAIAAAAAIYLVFVLASPGIFGFDHPRISTLRDLLDLIYVAAAAGAILWTHLHLPVSPTWKRDSAA
jgi:hypothetical protein